MSVTFDRNSITMLGNYSDGLPDEFKEGGESYVIVGNDKDISSKLLSLITNGLGNKSSGCAVLTHELYNRAKRVNCNTIVSLTTTENFNQILYIITSRNENGDGIWSINVYAVECKSDHVEWLLNSTNDNSF